MRRWAVAVLIVSLIVIMGASATAQAAPSKPVAKSPRAGEGGTEVSASLPVKRVVLYKNGVGYFEHSGTVRGNQDLNIEFTTAQLNDVLKSLTAVDLSGGQITGVRYNSIAPLSERLKTLQIGLGEDVTSAAFLNALRGTRAEVRSGGTMVAGRILSVETVSRETAKGGTVEVTQLSLVGDGGELRSFDMGSGTSVRILDNEIRQDVGRYLSLVGSTRSKDVRRMTISANGAGERRVFVSYISEVPVWKSTYRIVIPKAPGTPFLQGWAIVDNTVGEDWKDVQLSLVSGAPQSFIQNISQPYYARRPVMGLPQSVMLTPQEHEASLEGEVETSSAGVVGGVPGGVAGGVIGGVINGRLAVPPPPGSMSALAAPQRAVGPGYGGGIGGGVYRSFGTSLSGRITDPTGAVIPNAEVAIRNRATGAVQSTRTDSTGRYYFYGLPTGPSSLMVNSPGFQSLNASMNIASSGTGEFNTALNVGSTAETVMVEASAAALDTSMNAAVMAAMRAQDSVADGAKLGELFEYALKQKITVLKNQSALVPIVQSPIEAERVTLVTADANGDVRTAPLRALWLRNTSGVMLDGGTFNVLEEDAFAGEGLMDVLHPDERRLLSYAADTAVHVKANSGLESGMATKVRINRGMLQVTREERSTRHYEIRNADDTAREVVIEHPIRVNFQLAGDVKPSESSSNFHRFKVKVEPKQTKLLDVKEVRPDMTVVYLNSITDEQVAYFVRETKLSPEVEQELRRIVAKKGEIGAVDRDINLRQRELNDIDRDQTRVRENMKALKGSAEEKELLQRYARQLNSQEDRLNALRSEISGLQEKRAKAQAELERMIEGVDVNQEVAGK